MNLPARVDLGIIGGTGVEAWPGLENVQLHEIDTPWGRPSAALRIGRWQGARLAFLPRHGDAHQIAPHAVNYRANLWAMHALGAPPVLGTNAVGGITEAFAPASLALPDQLIDYTWGREASFHAGVAPVPHAEFADPYSPRLREQVLAAAAAADLQLVARGCYGATQGPRLETRAEIARLRRDGCDLVGMTGMPEAALARELGLDYACLAVVANWAAGCGDDAPITMDEVRANVALGMRSVPPLVAALLRELPAAGG